MPRLTVLDPDDQPAAGVDVLDVPHPHEQSRRRFGRRTAFRAAALAWTTGAPLLIGGPSFELREHVGWLADDAASADPTDVVKQISFLHKSESVDLDGFRSHYRHHVEVARRHMHTLWQYVQYDVIAIDGPRDEPAQGIVAVSVLWFRSTDDFCNRYFASPEDQAQFQAEEGFLDLSKAFSFVVTSHPSAGPAGRPQVGA
jgi:hypothetical protein